MYHCEKSQYINMNIKNGGKYTKLLQLTICHLEDRTFSHFYFLLYNLTVTAKFPIPSLYYFILFQIFKNLHFFLIV